MELKKRINRLKPLIDVPEKMLDEVAQDRAAIAGEENDVWTAAEDLLGPPVKLLVELDRIHPVELRRDGDQHVAQVGPRFHEGGQSVGEAVFANDVDLHGVGRRGRASRRDPPLLEGFGHATLHQLPQRTGHDAATEAGGYEPPNAECGLHGAQSG